MRKNNKGFTLIELLAIIVILAIIAVITVPIILNIIENSRKGAAIDSAYGYKDAIEKYYLTELSNDTDFELENGDYVVNDGVLSYNDITHIIPISGTAPSSGYVTIENNEVTSSCLTINDYKVELTNEGVTAIKGKCSNEAPVKFGGDVVDGDRLASLGPSYTGVKAIVYLDPTNLATICNETNAVSTNETKSGCMKWYVIDALSDDDTYTMLLDHNTTNKVAWVSEEDYKQEGDETANPESVGILYGEVENMTDDGLPAGTWEGSVNTNNSMLNTNGINNRGPITILNQLKVDTANWVVAKTLTEDEAYTASWTCTNSYNQNSYCNNHYTGKQEYTINYNGYQARLLSSEEIAKITNDYRTNAGQKWTLGSGEILFDEGLRDCFEADNCSLKDSKYGWLFENTTGCEYYGCNAKQNGNNGYWLSSPDASYARRAKVVYHDGRLIYGDVIDSNAYGGVRPVITVSKSLLEK